MKDLNKILIILTILAVGGCEKQQKTIFEQNPSNRIRNEIKSIEEKLTTSKNGWKLKYFPNLNENRYTDVRKNLYTDDLSYIRLKEQEGFGYGGYTFFVKFEKENIFKMQSDFEVGEKITKGVYKLLHKNAIQLSFFSRNPIHNLTAKGFNGRSTFVVKKIKKNKIILATIGNTNNGKEYIILEKIKKQINWKEYFQKIATIKNQFENMRFPVLEIRNSKNKTVFRSDYYPRKISHIPRERKPLFIENYKRYALFVQNVDNNYNSKFFVGIGSGYAFTENKIIFKDGIIYKNIVFKEFENIKRKVFVTKVNGYTAYIKEK